MIEEEGDEGGGDGGGGDDDQVRVRKRINFRNEEVEKM